MSIRFAILLVLALPMAIGACTTPNTGDCQDACSHQTERTFCDIDGVYPGTVRENECIAPPSADACNRIESCPEGQVCTDDSMGVCVACTENEHCGDGQSCSDGNTCVVDSCTPGVAGDEACLASNADLPRCGPDETCVACLTSSDCSGAGVDASVCDEKAFACRGCIANSECESKVCSLQTGVCATEDDIVHVAKTGTDGASCGTLGSPCLTIAAGLAQVTADRNAVVIGAGEYAEQLVLTDFAVALVGDGVVNINPSLGDNANAVLVSGSSDVSIDGIDIALTGGASSGPVALRCDAAGGTPSLSFSQGTISGSAAIGVRTTGCPTTITASKISGNGSTGILVSGGALSITRSTISKNSGSGIFVSDGALSISRSRISENGTIFSAVGGIQVVNSEFAIVNNSIVNNGAGSPGFNGSTKGGLNISNTVEVGTQVLDFNTIANNRTGPPIVGPNDAKASNLHCEVTTPLVASGNIIVGGLGENSQGMPLPNLFASNCSFEYSNIEDGPAGTGNIDATPLFVNPVSGDEGDFHLQSSSPCIDAADPAATLDIDVDGEPRPQGGGHDMGADEAG